MSSSDRTGTGNPERSKRWKRMLPGILVMRHYQSSWIKGDVIGGITVAAYLVPQVMAYAIIVGLPVVIGLWAVIAPMLLYFFLGTSRKLSIGPESTTALMTAAGVGALVGAAGGPERYAEIAALLTIAVGIVCLLAYIARLGFLTRLLSRPVLIGYLIGIAVLMMVSQVSKVTKIDISGDNIWQELHSFISQRGNVHIPTLLCACVISILLFASKKLIPKFPSALAVLLLAALVVAIFNLDRFGLEIIGEVPRGLPEFRIPHLGDLQIWTLLPYAVGIAIVGFSDNILSARAFASDKDETIDANQELLALGTANIANGFLQGFPVSSSGSRTVLGETAGTRTQVHSLVVVAIVIIVLLFAGPVLETFPTAALGALVIYAATQLIDFGELRRIAKFSKSELAITAVTAAAVVALGVLAGIGVAITLSLLDLIRRITTPNADVLGYAPGVPGMHSLEDYPESTAVEGLVVFRYDSPLFFANADDFTSRALIAVDNSRQPVEWFLLNAEGNTEVDLTAVDALEYLREHLEDRGIHFALARVKQDLYRRLETTSFVRNVGKEYFFATLPTAVNAYATHYKNKHGHEPGGVPPEILAP